MTLSALDALAFEDGTFGGRASRRIWYSYPAALAEAEGYTVLCEDWYKDSVRRAETSGMLEQFLKLAQQDDQAVSRFSGLYGSLNLCRHGVPLDQGKCSRFATDTHLEGERTDHWRDWAKRFAATIEVGRRVNAGEQPSETLVNRMLSGHSDDTPFSSIDAHINVRQHADWLKGAHEGIVGEKLRTMQARYFSLFLNTLIRTQAVILPTRKRVGPRLRIEYGASGLFSALAFQVALAALDVVTLMFCSNCGDPYAAQRRNDPTKRSYCPKHQCRVLAAQRDASRAYRLNHRKPRVSRQAR